MSANEKQVGGDHYKVGGEEHWDRVERLGMDYFQAQITKYVERCWKKNGLQDLKKAQHFLEKYIELRSASEIKVESVVTILDSIQAPTERYTFREFEQGNPAYVHDQHYTCEGGMGTGLNVYTCKLCRQEVVTPGLEEAHAAHDARCQGVPPQRAR